MKYIVSVSGGKDSTAVLLDALDRIPKEDIIPVFMDTKWEPEEVYYYLSYLEWKLDINIVRLESEGMEALSLRKKMMPNRVMRFCTENLKIRPFHRWLKENFVDKNIEYCVLQGIRREESANRKDTPIYDLKISAISPKFHILSIYPICDWTKDEVFKFIEEKGIRKNPLYDKGYTRVGCMPCIFASKWELLNMEEKYVKRLRDLEEKMSKLLNKPVNFFPDSMDRHVRQELLFRPEIEYYTCEKCGATKFFEEFCANCWEEAKTKK